jgi:hypothetical protein
MVNRTEGARTRHVELAIQLSPTFEFWSNTYEVHSVLKGKTCCSRTTILIKVGTGGAACAGNKAEERFSCEWEPKAQRGGLGWGFSAKETAGGRPSSGSGSRFRQRRRRVNDAKKELAAWVTGHFSSCLVQGGRLGAERWWHEYSPFGDPVKNVHGSLLPEMLLNIG